MFMNLEQCSRSREKQKSSNFKSKEYSDSEFWYIIVNFGIFRWDLLHYVLGNLQQYWVLMWKLLQNSTFCYIFRQKRVKCMATLVRPSYAVSPCKREPPVTVNAITEIETVKKILSQWNETVENEGYCQRRHTEGNKMLVHQKVPYIHKSRNAQKGSDIR